jgi:hypothetical protein
VVGGRPESAVSVEMFVVTAQSASTNAPTTHATGRTVLRVHSIFVLGHVSIFALLKHIQDNVVGLKYNEVEFF